MEGDSGLDPQGNPVLRRENGRSAPPCAGYCSPDGAPASNHGRAVRSHLPVVPGPVLSWGKNLVRRKRPAVFPFDRPNPAAGAAHRLLAGPLPVRRPSWMWAGPFRTTLDLHLVPVPHPEGSAPAPETGNMGVCRSETAQDRRRTQTARGGLFGCSRCERTRFCGSSANKKHRSFIGGILNFEP